MFKYSKDKLGSSAEALEFCLFRISIKFLGDVYWVVECNRELMEMHSHHDPAPKSFKLHPSPLAQPEKYQSAYGNKLALSERRMQTGYESTPKQLTAVLHENLVTHKLPSQASTVGASWEIEGASTLRIHQPKRDCAYRPNKRLRSEATATVLLTGDQKG
jgi:hypothetical protein